MRTGVLCAVAVALALALVGAPGNGVARADATPPWDRVETPRPRPAAEAGGAAAVVRHWTRLATPEPRPAGLGEAVDPPNRERWHDVATPRPRPGDLVAEPRLARRSPGSLVPLDAAPIPDPGLTLRQRIGQMFIIGFSGQTRDDPGVRRVADYLERELLGGVLVMRRNVSNKRQVRRLIAYLRGRSPLLTPLIAVDQEGGHVQRLGRAAGFSPIPSARRIADGERATARARYRRMAAELAEVGVNLNLAPVVDLDRNSDNPIIARFGRSYGADPDRVSAFAEIFIAAHRDRGIATVAKHFPGHGSSSTDTHTEFADVTGSWAAIELLPYSSLAGRLDGVMMAHVAHADLTGDADRPASLSARAVGKMRELAGEEVVAMTDDLEMAAVRERYRLDEAAVAAVEAGNDLLIFSNSYRYDPERLTTLIDAVEAAVRAGRISEARIAAAYRRIAALRSRVR